MSDVGAIVSTIRNFQTIALETLALLMFLLLGRRLIRAEIKRKAKRPRRRRRN
jgi:hypothetical protein